MNARGAMELIMATVARDAGLIDDRIFVALVFMALFTTLLSSPMIDRLIIHRPEKIELISTSPISGWPISRTRWKRNRAT